MKRIRILSWDVSSAGLVADAQQALGWISSSERGKFMACANPHSLVQAKANPDFAEALRRADLLLPDGAGILLAARMLGVEIRERVAGMDFFLSLTMLLDQSGGGRIFFLGASPAVLENLRERLAHEFPNVEVVGVFSPPYKPQFSEQDNLEMIAAINAADANVLWVGMTAPKQEQWILQNRERLNVNFIGAIGAVFDFYAGTKKRAPQWVCDLGLEWLPRLLREPKRLWRRTFVSGPLFFLAVIRQKIARNAQEEPVN